MYLKAVSYSAQLKSEHKKWPPLEFAFSNGGRIKEEGVSMSDQRVSPFTGPKY